MPKKTDELFFKKAEPHLANAIAELVNSAYRGESSKQGWTTEADLLGGQRIDAGIVSDLIAEKDQILWLAYDQEQLMGCVQLRKTNNEAYLGLLTVRPNQQAQGVGKKILQYAEDFVRTEWQGQRILMNVISVRTELIAFYERRGYRKTNERTPMPRDNPRYFGIPKQEALQFLVMEKEINPYVIETHGLSRTYKSYRKPEGVWNSIKGLWSREHTEKIALHPTDLRIEPGQIVGLVGANGAGKTTLLKILSGLIVPTSGQAQVLGRTPWKREEKYLKNISILLGQKNQLWWDLAPLDSFALLARIYDLDLIKARTRVQELAKKLQCEQVLETQLRRLSLGERMKMEIIGALLHEPQVLFLDEPTIGLDIVAQETIRDFLTDYVKNKGPTIILTSHYMDDITQLAHRLLLISKGQIVFDGTVSDFTAQTESLRQLTLRYTEDLAGDVDLPGGHHLHKGAREFHLKLRPDELGPLMMAATQYGQIQDLKLEETDFEDVIKGFLEKESRLL